MLKKKRAEIWLLLSQLTSDVELTAGRAPSILCVHLTFVQTRVLTSESGHMKSDSSSSEGIFVILDSTYKLFILIQWGLNTPKYMKHSWKSVMSYKVTVDEKKAGGAVRFGCERPLQCDVLVLFCLIGALCHIHHKCWCWGDREILLGLLQWWKVTLTVKVDNWPPVIN